MFEKKLSLFGLVCNVIHKEDDQSEKNIMLYSHHKDSMANTLGELSDVIRRCDILRVKSEVRGSYGKSSYIYWELGNKSISRKKFEPLLRHFYHS